ncbi:metalloendopeptidase-like membrane protein [Xenococcus sp. PCC 7305]|uniref:M23 family metallopeptidase n=1 Tax=Xenococcus sp. PCC 7305 TaxID=102125 RepID=UPI0002AC443B|nr:M23 family metallopeptidase [Xenococcus sp. PCC 7305]ELS04947.1 metalloendopeptidase-like membrane protein [Xenococcus sp. PCC 7305]
MITLSDIGDPHDFLCRKIMLNKFHSKANQDRASFNQIGLTGIVTTFLLSVATAVAALEVEIAPTTPELGDTISIIVTTDEENSKPIVTVGEKSYPVFLEGDKYRALLPTSPLDKPGKITVRIQGDDRTSNIGVWLKNRTFPTQRIHLSGKAASRATQLELDKVAAFKQLVTPEKYWNGSFVRPNAARVSTIFGVRRYYNGVFAENYYHKGVDYAGSSGSPVVAPAAGKVRLIGREADGFRVHGNIVGVDHGQGVLSVFMHLRDINVQEGDLVQPGQKIGTVGSTGASTGPHLHWGLYVNGVAVDPAPWRFGEIP